MTYTLPSDQVKNIPDHPRLRMQYAEEEKTKGNEALRSGDIQEAIVYYTRSLQIYPTVACQNNRALAHIKASQYREAEHDASAVIEEEPGNIKVSKDNVYLLHTRIERK
eukprot:m.85537 g.85537  ORF g.85537 m.85537 type:complete len:109 (+) comp14429_c0_seq2:690-1016(+)